MRNVLVVHQSNLDDARKGNPHLVIEYDGSVNPQKRKKELEDLAEIRKVEVLEVTV